MSVSDWAVLVDNARGCVDMFGDVWKPSNLCEEKGRFTERDIMRR